MTFVNFLFVNWAQGVNFVSFMIYSSGAKFEKQFFNISRDFLYSVFYDVRCKLIS